MPSWPLISLALAVQPPVVAECDGDPSLQSLVTDPSNTEIELQPGCDHPLVSPDITWTVTVRGQPPAVPEDRPRILFPDTASNDELFRVISGGDLTVEAVDLVGTDGLGVPRGRALNALGGTVRWVDVSAYDFELLSYSAVIYIDDTVLTVEASDFHDNQGQWGGVIWVQTGAEATFTDVTLRDNTATGTGGFAFVESGATLSLFGIDATDHTADYGGLVGTRGTVVVDGLTSDGHTATSTTGGAFNLENSNASLSLCNADLSNGSAATLGGAIHARGAVTLGTACALGVDPGPVSLTNHAATDGGALEAVGASAPVVLSDVSFQTHSASDDGGTLFLQANTASLTNVTIDGSSAGGRGGGMFVNAMADFEMVGSSITAATAVSYGGCITMLGGAKEGMTLTDVELEVCATENAGGGLYTNGGLTAEGLTVRSGVATLDGGGMHLATGAERVLDGVTVTDSYALVDGGAISLQATNNIATLLSDVTVERCDALNGGALSVRDSTVVVDRFRFDTAIASDGGAVIVSGNNANATLRRGLVCNTASGMGAVTARTTSPTLVLDQVGFLDNLGVRGGAVELQDSADATLGALHLVGNEASFGGAVYVEAGVPATLDDAVVVDNHASSFASGAIDGLVPTNTWYEANLPVANPDDPLVVDTPAGMLLDGTCSWAALRTVDRAEQRGVWGPVSPSDDTWPDGTNPFRDDDGDGVPWLHDCDDANGERSYLAEEICDGLDNDCDGLVDDDDPTLDASTAPRWYLDGDQDQRGDENVSLTACVQPEGYVHAAGDCDDSNPSLPLQAYRDLDGDGIGAGAPTEDLCATPAPAGLSFQSDDCDDDDPTVRGPQRAFLDEDLDGFGSQVEVGEACPGDLGFALNTEDCDDTRSDIFPGADEVCDGIDQDCDNQVDEGVMLEVWVDNDGDGVGSGNPTLSCDPDDGALLGGDCNDQDPGRAFDCDEETATTPGDDDDDGPDDTVPTEETEPGVASSGCACDQQPTPWTGASWLARRR